MYVYACPAHGWYSYAITLTLCSFYLHLMPNLFILVCFRFILLSLRDSGVSCLFVSVEWWPFITFLSNRSLFLPVPRTTPYKPPKLHNILTYLTPYPPLLLQHFIKQISRSPPPYPPPQKKKVKFSSSVFLFPHGYRVPLAPAFSIDVDRPPVRTTAHTLPGRCWLT